MYLNPVYAVLHNTKLNRWHPILFAESPLPGNPRNLVRHKSRGHHTNGFESREEAIANAKEGAAQIACTRFVLQADIPWDGEGIPAMTAYFLGEGENTEITILG